MWNKCKLVMLPTNEKAKENDIILLKKKGNISSIEENKIALCVFPDSNDLGNIWETQHLYFLSDEEIKDGDFYYWSVTNTIQKAIKDSLGRLPKIDDGSKKIIATTDKSLVSEYCCIKSEGLIAMNAACRERNRCLLPQIPQSFIEHFVTEYNKGNIITEVTVEYVDNGDEDWIGDDYNGEPFWNEKIELKTNSDNTINIKPIKTSWSREEVINILKEYREFVWKNGATIANLNKWIEENL